MINLYLPSGSVLRPVTLNEVSEPVRFQPRSFCSVRAGSVFNQ